MAQSPAASWPQAAAIWTRLLCTVQAAPALARCVGDAGADRLSLIAVGDADVIADPHRGIYGDVEVL